MQPQLLFTAVKGALDDFINIAPTFFNLAPISELAIKGYTNECHFDVH